MKYFYIIILLFPIQLLHSQNLDSIQSRAIEIKGWELYFDDDKPNAKKEFSKAIELDSTNILAKIGLFNSKSENEITEDDFELIDKLPKEENNYVSYSDIMLGLMMTNQIDKELPDSIKVMRNKHDEEYIKFKAALTDSEFKVYSEDGNVRKSGEFKDRKPFGIWKSFGYQNKLHHSFTFPKVGDTVIIKYYKPDGDIIREEWITGMPFTNNSKKFKEIIYWQEKLGKEKGYLFVSKDGFKIYDRNNPVVFDDTTPDNVIRKTWNPETKSIEAFIWKNGKKEPYEFCEDDGIVVSYMENGEKKSFRWENCKKVPIEN